jgi:hypothetical protein
MNQLNQQILKNLFDYREDGNLIRKKSIAGNGNSAGAVVGSIPKKITRSNRYVMTKIQGQHYCVHKLIYMWHTGVWPEQIDHINTNSLDNRIENLRLATTSQNASNRKMFCSNTSGAKGVSWHKAQKKWFVYMNVNKKRKNIGYFDNLELAKLVAIEARDKYHGVYANHF